MSTRGKTRPRRHHKQESQADVTLAEEKPMETKVNTLIAIAALQALCLASLCLRPFVSPPSPAYAGDAQEVQIVDQRLSRYNPLPVTIRNDDAIRVKCID
jgi:hypothetical protein